MDNYLHHHHHPGTGSRSHTGLYGHPGSYTSSSAGGGSRVGTLRSHDSRESIDDRDREKNTEKVKLKLMSIWNNVKYGWSIKIRASFNPEIPIWLLGVKYQSEPGSESNNKNNRALELFKEDFSSRIWLTYRRDFKRLPGSMLTSDRGWGCMLRTGQMMLTQAFINHYLGRDWRWNRTQSDKSGMIHRMIIKWFADDPTSDCPFSVHQLMKMASILGKKPGDWFGPSSVAVLLREALAEAAPSYPILNNICIYVAHDCTIFIQDVIDLCTKPVTHKKSESINRDSYRSSSGSKYSNKARFSLDYGQHHRDSDEQGYFTLDREDHHRASISSRRKSANDGPFYGKAMSTINLVDPLLTNNTNHHPYHHNHHHQPTREFVAPSPSETNDSSSREKWRSVVIIVPVRLGSDCLNPIYANCIKSLFRHKACIGIIGGRPKHSLYFVGCQDDKLIYLDPHNDQEAIDADQSDFPLNSYHCDFPRKLSINRMDPSCAIGFYCQTRQDFMDLIDTVGELIVPRHNKLDYPMFVFSEGTASSHRLDFDNSFSERTVRVKHRCIDSLGRIQSEMEADEFVMI